MEKKPFDLFLISIVVMLLNINTLFSGGNSAGLAIVATTGIYILWGWGLFLLFRESRQPAKVCIRLLLVVFLLFLWFKLNMWMSDHVLDQGNSAIEKILELIYLAHAIPFAGFEIFGLDGFEIVYTGYGITGVLICAVFLWMRTATEKGE